MGTLRLILGDHLSRDVAALDGLEAGDVVLMVEVAEETTYVPHHKQKIAFILSAMRHFARELGAEGIVVDYVRLDDPANSGSFTGEVLRAIDRHGVDRIVVTEPGEWRVRAMMEDWTAQTGLPVEIREDDRFLCSRGRFARWAEGRKAFRMEFFYREMRRETGLLMEGDKPVGGQWNYDAENRKALPKGTRLPRRLRFAPDDITRGVLDLVAARFPDHFGDLEPFGWAVTRADALAALDHFITEALPSFGDVQDAMKRGEPFLYHGLVSPYLNVGLLTAREVCVAAERAFRRGLVPLNAAEGFIRQILGWREYVRGIYWHRMPGYAETNALAATRPLPWFYWSGETDMACIAEVVGDTRRNAYAHHIQRLMVTGLYTLLLGVQPQQVHAWYLGVYVDAVEWVELPNVLGMALFADGGLMASKPYAATGKYIQRMGNHCSGCRFDPALSTGDRACPFTTLYWDFLGRHEARLSANPRMALQVKNLARLTAEQRSAIAARADALRAGAVDA